MNPDAARLIELAIRPLASDAELSLAAKSELGKSIELHAADQPTAIAEAADSLARADKHPLRGRWRLLLYLVTLLVSMPLIIHTVRQVAVTSGLVKLISQSSLNSPASRKITNLDSSQQLLLYGDTKAKNASDRWKPLWESEPGNPMFLAEYAGGSIKDHTYLSPEILTVAERIDPDNGWFLAFSAAANAEAAVKREKRSSKDVKDGKAPVMTILDEKLLDESLVILHQIAVKPRFTSYQIDLLRRRIPLFPPRRDFVSQIPLLTYVASLQSPSISLRKIPDILAAGAQQCAVKGDVEGFIRIIGDWRALVTASCKGGSTLVDLLVVKVTMMGPAANFRDAAQTLGLEEETRYFAKLDEAWRSEKDARNQRDRATSAEADLFKGKSSILGGLTAPLLDRQVQNPPAFTDEDMRPARYADHALFGRALSGFGWVMLVIGVIVASSVRYSKSKMAGGLFRRMADLLRPWDWFWLITGGVVFPVIWYLTITRLTPLTAREWSVTYLNFIPLGGQFGSLLMSLFILPTVIASGLLAKRGAVLGLTPRFPWLGWVAAGVALAGVPMFGAVPLYAHAGNLVFVLALFPICALAAWILSGFAFGQGSHGLRRSTLGHIVLPVWVSGILALALLIPFHYAEEKRWIQRDTMGEISTEAPSMSRHEYEVTQILRTELLERIAQPAEGH